MPDNITWNLGGDVSPRSLVAAQLLKANSLLDPSFPFSRQFLSNTEDFLNILMQIVWRLGKDVLTKLLMGKRTSTVFSGVSVVSSGNKKSFIFLKEIKIFSALCLNREVLSY